MLLAHHPTHPQPMMPRSSSDPASGGKTPSPPSSATLQQPPPPPMSHQPLSHTSPQLSGHSSAQQLSAPQPQQYHHVQHHQPQQTHGVVPQPPQPQLSGPAAMAQPSQTRSASMPASSAPQPTAKGGQPAAAAPLPEGSPGKFERQQRIKQQMSHLEQQALLSFDASSNISMLGSQRVDSAGSVGSGARQGSTTPPLL